MIVVRVELWSAITREKTELARVLIWNAEGSAAAKRNYAGGSLRGRSREAFDKAMTGTRVFTRHGQVRGHPAERVHVWNLVAKMLAAMGYGDE